MSMHAIAVLGFSAFITSSIALAGTDRPVKAKSISTSATIARELEDVHFAMVDRLTKRVKTQDANAQKLSVSAYSFELGVPTSIDIEAITSGSVDIALIKHSSADNRAIIESQGISSHAIVPGVNHIAIDLGKLTSGEYTLRVSQGAVASSMTFVVR